MAAVTGKILYPYNKQFIDLSCSVCTVKYRTEVFFVRTSLAALAWSVLKNLSPIFHGTDLTLGQQSFVIEN